MAVANITERPTGEPTLSLPFGSDTVSYRIVLEPAMILPAGPMALLLQVTEPSIAAGVAQHSDYEARPWVRLFRTLELMMMLAFGSPQQTAKAKRRFDKRHATVKGTRDDGVPYRAGDPDLLVWVWATLAAGLVHTHNQFVRKLAHDERDQLYEEWKVVGYACGIPVGACPETWVDFETYFDRMVSERLVPTEVAMNVAGQVRRPPLPFPLNRMAGALLGVLTGGQLPEHLREQLGFSWSPAHRAVFDATTFTTKTAARFTPGPLRRLPMAIAMNGPNWLRFPGART